MRALIIGVMVFLVVLSIPLGCGDFFETPKREEGETPSPPPSDPCAGPVPCLTEDWELTDQEFEDQYGDPVIVSSMGTYAWVEGIVYDHLGSGHWVSLHGPVVDCYNAKMWYGWMDLDGDGIEDPLEQLRWVDAGLEICNETLRVYDILLEAEPYHDIEATYVGPQEWELSE